MITDQDIQFHTPDGVAYDWAETGFFNFYVPEHNLHGWVYIVHRAGVGACVCDVEVVDTQSHDPLQARYIDLQHHLPLPARAEAFTLPNGLSFAARSIRDYRIDYTGFDDTELHLELTGLMEPYDIHDPDMDPMAVADQGARAATTGFGAAYAAHFDMSVQVRGQLKLRGENFAVDCVATMDHSWGPRPESTLNAVLWANAHFDDGLVLHSIWSLDRAAPRGQQHVFRHGYAVVDGKVRGVRAGRFDAVRNGHFVGAAEMALTDVDGTEHVAFGTMLTSHLWAPYGNNLSQMTMHRWQARDGRRGMGTVLEGVPTNRWTGTAQVAPKLGGR